MAKENHILPQLKDLNSTAKSDNPFVEDTRTFVNADNIGLIQAISARNMQKINARIPDTKGHTKWLWLGSSILLLTSVLLYFASPNFKVPEAKQKYQVKNISPGQYQNDFTISFNTSTDDKFRPNYHQSKGSIKELNDNYKEEENIDTEDDNNSHDIKTENHQNTEKQENPYLDDNTNYQPLSGEKFNTNQKSELDRDASIPLKFSKAVVAKQENYYVFTEGKTFSYNMSEMPQYRGGKSKIESDLHANLSKANFPGSFDKKVNAVLTFVVDSRGKVKDIKVIGTPNTQIKTEIIKAVNGLSTWSKSSKSGKKGSLYYEIMLSFH